MLCMIFNQILFDFERSDQLLYSLFYSIPHFIFLGSLCSKSFKIYKTIFHVLYDF